jgi:UDP-glucose 4-epimerase
MRLLVTGGAGYIGSHLADRLLAEGHDVVVVDDLSLGKIANIEHNLQSPRFRFIEGDILDSRLMERLTDECELIYHLAAIVGVRHVLNDPLQTMTTNVWGTGTVLKAASRRGLKVVLASSSEVYGKSTACPLAEDGDRLLGSTAVARWCYSTAKAMDEHLALAYHRQRELPVTIVRYFNSYGPRLDPRGYGSVVARFISQALAGEPLTVHGDGEQTRCFTYVDDTVEGTVLAGTVPAADGEALNIARGEEIGVRELAEAIRGMTGSPSEVIYVPYEVDYGELFEDTRRRVPAVDKAERVLGFRARVPLVEGLQQTIDWFRNKG